ncbi:taste receptor type 1 member 3-like [Salvelinus namaycush]|uniref:Taste receptor type 1 member 3 n=1 Tax=Salvelinus namaycush TaxID=8040 RepID=A0A8U1H7E5_SALNM|nr:taste receptor type 1 member 3-like [Salvelinus namaycush]
MAVPLRLLVLCWVLGAGRSQSSPPWFQNITTNLFNSSGDILLGGLFPINELTSNLSHRVKPDNISCDRMNEHGLGMALVMKYTVDEINANSTLLPGIRLGYEIFDTCKQSAVIVKPTLFFLTEDSSRELAVMCNYTDYVTRVVAVIGPSTSEMVSVIGKLLGFFLIPQISYLATSDMFSDKSMYPSFLRTVPSDKRQVEAMVYLLNRFQWNWVAVVGSEDEYGRQGQRQFSTLAARNSICVGYEGLIPMYRDPQPVVREILDRIAEAKVGVVVVFSLSQPARAFFTEVIRRNLTGVWVASEDWALHRDVSTLPNIHTVGTIIAFAVQSQTLDLLTPYTRELFSRIREERARQPSPDTESTRGMNQCPDCWNLSPDNLHLVTEPILLRSAFSVYAAIYSVAHALHNLLRCNANSCPRGAKSKVYPWQLLEVLKKVNFSLNGSHFEFDSNGNPNIGYNVLQWVWRNNSLSFKDVGTFYKNLSINNTLIQWHTGSTKAPESTCSSECGPGQVRRVKGFHSCCYDCIECLPGTFQNGTMDIQCSQCLEGQWSLVRSTNCTEPTFDFLTWGQPESLGLLLAMLVLLACQGAVGVLLLQHRGSPLVRASGGALGGVALLSLMGGCACLLLFLGQPGELVCRLQLPVSSIFQTVTLSTILAISLQIVYVTEFPGKAPFHLDTLRGPGGCLLVLACCGVQAGICGYYVQEGPSLSQYLAKMRVNFVRKFLRCPVEPILGLGLMQGFNGLLALTSFMCTFMAVKTVRQYNLARDITFSTLTYCVVWVVFIPIYTGLNDKDRSIVHVSVSLLSNMGLMVAYYLPKCHLLLKKPELNTEEHFRTFLEGAEATPQEEHDQGPAGEGQGSAGEGQGSAGEGQGSGKGQGSAGEGQGSGKGQGSAGEGQGSAGEGQGSTGEGQGSTGEGQGSTGEGQESAGEGQGSTGEGQGSGKGQG